MVDTWNAALEEASLWYRYKSWLGGKVIAVGIDGNKKRERESNELKQL